MAWPGHSATIRLVRPHDTMILLCIPGSRSKTDDLAMEGVEYSELGIIPSWSAMALAFCEFMPDPRIPTYFKSFHQFHESNGIAVTIAKNFQRVSQSGWV